MEKIKVKCPFCGKILIVADDPANMGKKLRCPVCKESSVYEDFKRVAGPEVSDATQVIFVSESTPVTFILKDKTTGYKYSLNLGRNLIGRMTYKSKPKADVPIKTKDMGFSREHLFIEIVKGCDGVFHCYAVNASNKNDTFINGEKLHDSDKMAIKDGDQIKSSLTTLVFECSGVAAFDDGTKI